MGKNTGYSGYDWSALNKFELTDENIEIVKSKRGIEWVKECLSDNAVMSWVCAECMFMFSRNDLMNIVKRIEG